MSDYELAIQVLVKSATSMKDNFEEVLKLGRLEGKSDEAIYNDVRSAFKGLPKSTFYRNLPSELKREYTPKSHVEHSTETRKVERQEPKIIHKTSDEINIPQDKPRIIDAETINEATEMIASQTREIANIVAETPSLQKHRVKMPKKMLGQLYSIAGKYAKQFEFVLIVQGDTVVGVEDQPLMEMVN